jgi:hypothetical protein
VIVRDEEESCYPSGDTFSVLGRSVSFLVEVLQGIQASPAAVHSLFHSSFLLPEAEQKYAYLFQQ